MSLIGSTYNLKTHHPQDLVDDLYREIFDLHPAESEVDVALLIRRADDEGGTTILDVRVMRATDGEGNHRVVFGTQPSDMLIEMIRWARRNDDGTDDPPRLLWMHKHPEGMAYASDKDHRWNETLTTIDFGLSEGSLKRIYVGGAVINRNASQPLKPMKSLPTNNTGVPEIDAAVTLELFRRWSADKNLAPDDPLQVMVNEVGAIVHQGDYANERLQELIPQIIVGVAKHSNAGPERIMQAIDDPVLKAEIEKLLSKALGPGEIVSMRLIGPDDTTPSQLPMPQNLIDILGLPQFGLPAADNTKQRKDRLN